MKDYYEPNLEDFRARYDSGELNSYETKAKPEPLAPKLTPAEYRALTPEEKRARLSLQQHNYKRRLARRKVYAK